MTRRRGRTPDRGSLLLVYSTLASFLVLGGTTAAVAFHEYRFSQRTLHKTQAFYLAEAGVDQAVVGLRADPDYTGASYVSVTSANGQVTGGYEVTVEDIGNDQREITAVGYYPSDHPEAEWYVSHTIDATVSLAGLFSDAAFAQDEMEVSGNGEVDSYDSSAAYGAMVDGEENIHENGDIGSNDTVELSGSAGVRGSVKCGKGLDPAEAIKISGSATVSGRLFAQPDNRQFTPVEVPDGLTDLGDLSITNTLSQTGGTYTVDDLTISGKGIVTFTGPTTLYVTGNIQIAGNGVATYADSPPNLIIKVAGDGNVKLSGNADFYGAIYAPEGEIKVTGNCDIYGALIGNEVEISGNGDIHYDERLANVGEGNVTFQLWRQS